MRSSGHLVAGAILALGVPASASLRIVTGFGVTFSHGGAGRVG